MKYLPLAFAAVPLLANIGKKIFGDDDDKKEDYNNRYNEDLREELNRQKEELREEKFRMEQINEERIKRINKLEEMMRDNYEEQRRKEIQKEIEEEERRKKEELKKLEEIEKKQEEIQKCRDFLSNEFSSIVLKTINNFYKEREIWLEKLNDKNLKNKLENLKSELPKLFNKLFDIEEVLKKISNKFFNILKIHSEISKLKQMNFMIIGTSGVGKSTLINQLFGEELAKEGIGQRCTTIRKRYESKNYPFLTLTDTMGTEIGSGHSLEEVEKDTLTEITNKLNSNDPNEHIHGIIYCTTSNRFFKDELKIILKIREKYDGKKLPIIIVYTKACDNEEVEAIRKAINEFLSEYKEEISDEIFGIEFIKIMAREKISEKMGKKFCDPCFGLSNLMSKLYKKGEKVYKIAIKNSLIQIAKNNMIDYVEMISNKISNYINYFFFLQKQFEPNFSDFIAYTFEKITDIENQRGIGIKELDKLDNFLKNRKLEKHESSSIDLDMFKEENLCIFCQNKPKKPYTCSFCGYKACENCYFNELENEGQVLCSCGCEIFSLYEEDKNNNKINEEEEFIDNNNNVHDYNNNVLNYNLSQDSKEEINKYIEEFKYEMLEIVGEKFEEYIKNASQIIYYQLLDIFRDNDFNEINFKEALKSKEEIKKDAENIIKQDLKESSEELFLTKKSSCLYQDIAQIFKNEMIKKIDEFINNLNNNEDFINFINYSNVFDDDNKLSIEDNFNDYIKSLKHKEEESYQKALQIQYEENSVISQGESYGKSMSQSYSSGY